DGMIETDGILVASGTHELSGGQPVTWCIRPDEIRISSNGGLPATVVDAVELPTVHEAILQLAPNLTLVVRDASGVLRTGGRCNVMLPPGAVHVWPETARTLATRQEVVATAG